MQSGAKSAGNTAWKVVISVLAVVLVLFLVAEVGIRTFISKQVASEAAAEGTTVSFGNSPVTLGLLSGKLPRMEIEQPSTLVVNGNEITGEPAAIIELHNVRLNGGEPVAESLDVSTILPNEAIRAMLNGQIEEQVGSDGFLTDLIKVSDVHTDPQAGTFTVTFTGGAAGIELKPTLENGQLSFEASSTELFGFNLPDRVSNAITGAMSSGIVQEVGGGLRIANMTVEAGGLRVTMAGEDVDFVELQQMQQMQPGELSYQP